MRYAGLDNMQIDKMDSNRLFTKSSRDCTEGQSFLIAVNYLVRISEQLSMFRHWNLIEMWRLAL